MGKVLKMMGRLAKKGFDWLTGKNLTPEQKAEMRKNLYGDGSIGGILGMKKPAQSSDQKNFKLKRRVIEEYE